jgi:hypothetical protein
MKIEFFLSEGGGASVTRESIGGCKGVVRDDVSHIMKVDIF